MAGEIRGEFQNVPTSTRAWIGGSKYAQTMLQVQLTEVLRELDGTFSGKEKMYVLTICNSSKLVTNTRCKRVQVDGAHTSTEQELWLNVSDANPRVRVRASASCGTQTIQLRFFICTKTLNLQSWMILIKVTEKYI